jgi:hypothetical protein
MSGSLIHSPADIIRYLLVGEGEGTLPSANGTWPIHVSSRPTIPDSVVVVRDTTGRDAGRLMPTGERVEHYGIQIQVRDANSPDGYTKSQSIAITMDIVASLINITIGSSTYQVQSIVRENGPLSLGTEEGTKREMFTINAIVSLKQTA